jgi:hypothetical protein
MPDRIRFPHYRFQIVAISSQTKSSLVTRTALAFGRYMPSDAATVQPRAGKPRLDLRPVLSSLRCLQQPTPRLDLLSSCLAGFFRCTPTSVDSFAGCSSPPAPHGSGSCEWRGPGPRHPRACSPAWLLPALSGPGFGSRQPVPFGIRCSKSESLSNTFSTASLPPVEGIRRLQLVNRSSS